MDIRKEMLVIIWYLFLFKAFHIINQIFLAMINCHALYTQKVYYLCQDLKNDSPKF